MSNILNGKRSSGPKLLGVLLKTIGVWSGIGGLASLPQAINFWRNYPDEQVVLEKLAETFTAPAILIVAGWLLFTRTNWFVAIAMPDANSGEEELSIESARNLLGVFLKALGYLEILNGLIRLPYEFVRLSRASNSSFDGIAYAGITIVAGCFLVFATNWLVQFAYRPIDPITQETISN